jgi:signal transduction histidine kinase
VLQNAVRNAVRHTPEGGLIVVRVMQDPDAVTISVSDTGQGIAAEDLPRIFERFYRGDPSRNRALGGAGLGLSIAREFVEAMGGTIGADSSPNGTTISVSLAAASRGSSEPPGSLG